MLPRLLFSASETIIDTDPQKDARAAEDFARDNAIVFTEIFAGDVRAMLDRACAQATFVEVLTGAGPRLREDPMRTAVIVRRILNRAPVRDWMAKITGCGPLADVRGSTARFIAGSGQHLDWHTDLNRERRRLGITIGLGHEAYEGGLFELKRKDCDDGIFRFNHARPFSLLVFRVDKSLAHRVTPVTAGGPRTVFGGWFVGPDEEPAP